MCCPPTCNLDSRPWEPFLCKNPGVGGTYDLPARLSLANWYEHANWAQWLGIKPGTTRFDSNLASILPLGYWYWNKGLTCKDYSVGIGVMTVLQSYSLTLISPRCKGDTTKQPVKQAIVQASKP